MSPKEKHETIAKELEDLGIQKIEADHLSAITVSNNLKYLFVEASLESEAFFTVRPSGG